METFNDLAHSVEDTSREVTNSGMEYFTGTLMSTEETTQEAPLVPQANNAGSVDYSKFDIKLHKRPDIPFCGDNATKDQGPGHQCSMSVEQDDKKFSCITPHRSLGDVFEENRKETDIKSVKSKIFDATCPSDNSSMRYQIDSNVSKAIRPENRSSVSYKPIKSEDSTTAQLVEDDLARKDGTTELSGLEENAKEAFMPSVNILGHNEVSNMCPTPETSDGDASTLHPEDGTDTDACTTTTANKEQAGGNMCEGGTIDSESKRSRDHAEDITDHGEDITEISYPAPSFKEADVKEKRNIFNDTPSDGNSSTGLHLQDTVTEIVSSDDNSPMTLKTEDSSSAGNEKKNFSSESQRSDNIATKLLESEHIDGVGDQPIPDLSYSHEVDKSLSGKIASSIKQDDSVNIKDSNISACSKCQGGGDVDTMEPENNTSIDDRRSSNKSSSLEPNTKRDDKTGAYEENNISPKGPRPNNSAVELFGPEHNGNEDYMPTDDINVSSSSELKTGANDTGEGRNKDFTRCDTSTACPESDKNALIDPVDKTSKDHGKSNSEFSCAEPQIRETNVNKGKSKICDATSPNSSSSPREVMTPVDHPTQSCNSINPQPEDSSTLRLTTDLPRSKKQPKKACGSKQMKQVNCRPKNDKPVHDQVIGATKTDGIASLEDGSNQSANISKSKIGTSSDAHKSDDFTINHNPEDTSSSSDEGENHVLSFPNPKSQDQAPSTEKNPLVSDTSSTCFQKHGDVSTTETTPREKSGNVTRVSWKAITIGLLFRLLMLTPAQAFPVQSQRQQVFFCKKNYSLTNQSLTITNMENSSSATCTFSFMTIPFFHNCSELESFVFADNETCVEMLTTDLTTKDWRLQYGLSWNGDDLPATRGELLDGRKVLNKISDYNNSLYSSADKNQTKEQSETEEENKAKEENEIKWIILLVLIVLAVIITLILLWCLCPKFRSCVKSCTGLGTTNDSTSVSNSNTDPSTTRFTKSSDVNDNINGADHRKDESERLNPESSEEPRPNTRETSF